MNSFNINLFQGTTFNISFTATGPTGNFLNLSGYLAQGGIKYNYGSNNYLLNFYPQVDPSFISGLITVSVQVPTGIPTTKGIYEIIAINSGINYSFKVIGGYANILPDIATY